MTLNTRCLYSIAFILSTLVSFPIASGRTLGSSPMFGLNKNPITQLAELSAWDGTANFHFANSASFSGSTAVVGAPNASISQPQQGAAYVFVKPISGWTNATQTAELIASDAAGGDQFGYSVAISGNTIVVGAFRLGAVYVFVKPKSGWPALMTQTAELIGPYNATGFGWSVAISGNTIVVGAPFSGSDSQGSAYLFVKPIGGWTNTFGNYTAELSASDLGGTRDDNFGSSVSVSGNTVVVGEPNGNNNAQPGSAYLFVKPAGGWANMTQTAELTASDALAGNAFGASVSISNSTVLVGAYCAPVTQSGCGPGAAYVFVAPSGGWVDGTQTAELTASDGADWDEFGESVSVSGRAVAIGASGATIGGNPDQGAAYMYTEPLLGWVTTSKFTAKLISSNGASADSFGFPVAINSGTVVVGAPGQAVGSNTAEGAAYIFGR
jgi:hypothetical protein